MKQCPCFDAEVEYAEFQPKGFKPKSAAGQKAKRKVSKKIQMIVKKVKMDDHNLLMVVSSLIAALGIKEIWQILKQKIDINAKKEERQDNLQAKVIEELKNKIDGLERKIDELITENTHLRIKIAKMEERLIVTAKKRNQNKYKDEG